MLAGPVQILCIETQPWDMLQQHNPIAAIFHDFLQFEIVLLAVIENLDISG